MILSFFFLFNNIKNYFFLDKFAKSIFAPRYPYETIKV
jgi:hypothetical protein